VLVAASVRLDFFVFIAVLAELLLLSEFGFLE
jgi:hypothetical protein